MPVNPRHWLRVLGTLLALSCLAWIAWRFHQEGVWQRVQGSSYAAELLRSTLFCIPLYCLGLCLLAVAWWCIQSAFSARQLPFGPLFAIYAVTQFGKYLPGNVGQYVGRHVLSRKYDMSHAALVLGTLAEAGFLLCASLVWAGSAINAALPALQMQLAPWQLALGIGLLLTAGVGATRLVARNNPKIARWLPVHSAAWLVPVWPLHLAFFGVMAYCFALTANVIEPAGIDPWLLAAAVATSWIAGFLVIGAPAGIGVREAVFVALLGGHLPQSDLLVLAACFRVVTFGGDLLMFAVGILLGGNRGKATVAEEPKGPAAA